MAVEEGAQPERRHEGRLHVSFSDPPVPVFRMLDLFSGTGSVGDVYRERGWEVVSLDSDPRWHADIQEDILQWEFTSLPSGHFHTIFAAPPCTEYSRSKMSSPRRLEEANAILLRVLEQIAYLQPVR